MECWRTASQVLRGCGRGTAIRTYSSSSSFPSSPRPRHLLSIADLTSNELRVMVQKAASYKREVYESKGKSLGNPASNHTPIRQSFRRKTVAMMFSKRSTRTRVSTEAAVNLLGGHPMFLGKDDIQLGVNESVYDTSKVISSMVSCIVARVGPHSDVEELARHSTAPVINALSDKYHPLQTIADFLTLYEAFPSVLAEGGGVREGAKSTPFKIAWVGDANNVLFDLAIGAKKLGVDIAVATPKGYEIPSDMRDVILKAGIALENPGKLSETNVPEEAVKDADVLVTDTWVSMGQEEEKLNRLKDFEDFQVTSELAARGGAKEGWKFMHCLPRHPEEVSDEVFYGDRSLVFPEAENRLYSALAVLDTFVAQKGNVLVRKTTNRDPVI